nr:hypothetical transcript [Hymenolepis microstoma]
MCGAIGANAKETNQVEVADAFSTVSVRTGLNSSTFDVSCKVDNNWTGTMSTETRSMKCRGKEVWRCKYGKFTMGVRSNLWSDEGKRHGYVVNPLKNFYPSNVSNQESANLNNREVSVASGKAPVSLLPNRYGHVKLTSSCPKLIALADLERFTCTQHKIPHSQLFPTDI